MRGSSFGLVGVECWECIEPFSNSSGGVLLQIAGLSLGLVVNPTAKVSLPGVMEHKGVDLLKQA